MPSASIRDMILLCFYRNLMSIVGRLQGQSVINFVFCCFIVAIKNEIDHVITTGLPLWPSLACKALSMELVQHPILGLSVNTI